MFSFTRVPLVMLSLHSTSTLTKTVRNEMSLYQQSRFLCPQARRQGAGQNVRSAMEQHAL